MVCRRIWPVPLLVLLSAGCQPPEPGASSGPACLGSLDILDDDDPLAYSAAWSPVDPLILAGTEHELRLLAVDDERSLRVADRVVAGHTQMSLSWSASGTLALSAGGDGHVRLWTIDPQAESLSEVTSLSVDPQGLFAVALSPDERHALACGHDGFLSLLRVQLDPGPAARLEIVDRFAAHRRCVVARWSPSGEYAASLGPEQTTFIYRVDTQAETLDAVAVVQSGEEPGAVAFGRDETEVILGTFGASRRVTDLQFLPGSGQLQERAAFDDFISGIKVIEPAHDPEAIVIAAHDGPPRLYHRTEQGLELLDQIEDQGVGSHAVSWSPDDRRLIRAASQLDRFELLTAEDCR